MERMLQLTADGSHTINIPQLQVSYHSKHGALKESMHVYIQAGLHYRALQKNEIAVLEVGLGTGLNTLLTLRQAMQQGLTVTYHALEPYPLSPAEAGCLNYGTLVDIPNGTKLLQDIHVLPWHQPAELAPAFTFCKHQATIQDVTLPCKFDVIYFDAFAPAAQPELWTQPIFEKLLHSTREGGCLVTYCSKSSVRRAMQAGGWQVGKLPGPPGKREMVRALAGS